MVCIPKALLYINAHAHCPGALYENPGPYMFIVTVHLPNQDTKANITNLDVSDADYLHYYSIAQIVVRLNRAIVVVYTYMSR